MHLADHDGTLSDGGLDPFDRTPSDVTDAYTPSRLDSNNALVRSDSERSRPGASGAVRTNPQSSRATVSPSQAICGSEPMSTRPLAARTSSIPDARSVIATRCNRPSPSAPTTSTPKGTEMFGEASIGAGGSRTCCSRGRFGDEEGHLRGVLRQMERRLPRRVAATHDTHTGVPRTLAGYSPAPGQFVAVVDGRDAAVLGDDPRHRVPGPVAW